MPSVHGRHHHHLENAEEHIYHVNEIITKIGEAGVAIKLKTCRFSNSMDYVGNIINPGRLEMDQSHKKATLKPNHRLIDQLYVRFLVCATCTIVLFFIPDFQGIAHPVNKVLCKGALEQFELNGEQLNSFKTFIK